MSRKEEFKTFIKKHPELIKYVKSGEMSWQKFFEIYSIYGESNDIWNKYFKENENTSNSMSINDLLEMVKKVDLDSVQKNISNISKAINLVQSLITTDEIKEENTYTPRPLYKKFED